MTFSTKKNFLFIFTVLIIINGCKKKDQEPVPQAMSCPEIDPTTFIGAFSINVDSSNFGQWGIMTGNRNVRVCFWKDPKNQWQDNMVASNHVSINGNTISIRAGTGTDFGYYLSSNTSIKLTNNAWSLSGDSAITFNYVDDDPFPSYSSSGFPDTISKSIGCTFTVNVANSYYPATLSVVDSIFGMVYDAALSFTLANGSNVISLTPAQLSSAGTGAQGAIYLGVRHAKIVKACDRNYMFQKNIALSKKLTITP